MAVSHSPTRASLAAALLVAALAACGPTAGSTAQPTAQPGGEPRQGLTLAEAIRRAPFPLLAPTCLPDRAEKTPEVFMDPYVPGTTDYLVQIVYWKRNPSRSEPNIPAVTVIHHRSFSPDMVVRLISGGVPAALDGRETVVFERGKGIEWMEAGTRIELSMSLGTPDDVLRAYHSMVTADTRCSMPIRR
jgi:hypothetical protein